MLVRNHQKSIQQKDSSYSPEAHHRADAAVGIQKLGENMSEDLFRVINDIDKGKPKIRLRPIP